MQENLSSELVNNKGAGLSAHPCRLLNTFVIRLLESVGAQRFSGRVLDSRPRGRGFEPHRRHCVVVLEQDTFILA